MSTIEKEILVFVVEQVSGEELEDSFVTKIKCSNTNSNIEKEEKQKIKNEIMSKPNVYQVYFEEV